MKTTKIALTILASIAGGAILGILFAPEKGSRTRRTITNKSSDYADDVKDSFEDLISSITKGYNSAWHDTERVIGNQMGRKHESNEKDGVKKPA